MLECYVRGVAKVDELLGLCDGLEAALREGEALKGKALEAVLQEAVVKVDAEVAGKDLTVNSNV